jgi:hypothetical protein
MEVRQGTRKTRCALIDKGVEKVIFVNKTEFRAVKERVIWLFGEKYD